MVRGRVLGAGVIVAVLVILGLAMSYNHHLEQQRTQAIAQLVSLPQYEQCLYDASTCPQSVENVSLPDNAAIAVVVAILLLGLYLIRTDRTHRAILDEMRTKRQDLSSEEYREIIYSVLTKDERQIIEAVRQQAGISQATLRLRVDMSKAKLSMLLRDLEGRGLIKRVEDGKTNVVHLKRGL